MISACATSPSTGKTGYGKPTLLKSVLARDMARGDGVLLLDPAGTLAEEALAFIPASSPSPAIYALRVWSMKKVNGQ